MRLGSFDLKAQTETENQPKISVIIPTYNCAATLRECLLSVIGQDYPAVELICMDGGSTDDTLALLAEYNDRIRYWKSEPDKGIYDAMNKGIDAATGEWIYFLGADDTLYTHTVLSDVFGNRALEAYDAVYGNVVLRPSGEVYDGPFDIYKLYRKNIAHQSLFVRKRVFGVTGKFNPKYRSLADYEMNLKWFMHPGLSNTYVNKTIANYHTGGSSQYGDPVFEIDRASLFRKYGGKAPPKVSVIVPVYNHAASLEKRINSVLDQSYPFFEVLMMDDGSTDGSQQIIEKYAGQDGRIKAVFDPGRAVNPGFRWNQGAELARGEYLWIAQPEDYADVAFLDRMTDLLDKNPSVGVAYCQSWVLDAQEHALGTYTQWIGRPDGQRWDESYFAKGSEEIAGHFINGNPIPSPSAALFRRSVFEQAGKADVQLTGYGDWLLWLKMLTVSDVAYYPGHFNFFRPRNHHKKEKAPSAHAGERMRVRKRFEAFMAGKAADPEYNRIIRTNQALLRQDREAFGAWQIGYGNPWRGLGALLALSFYPRPDWQKLKAGLYHFKKRLRQKASG